MLAEPQLKQLRALTGALSNNELIWTQGFLAGVLSVKDDKQSTPESTPALPVAVKKVSILYGTETGNSKALAMRFVQKAKSTGQAVKLVSLDQYRPEDLAKEEMRVAKINWIKYAGLDREIEAITKIRYKDRGSLSALTPTTDGLTVRFFEKAKGIAPGQSAVFYEGNDVIGGGIIQRP